MSAASFIPCPILDSYNARRLVLSIEGEHISLSDAIGGLELALAMLREKSGLAQEEFELRINSNCHASFAFPYRGHYGLN